jgi:hypothetical protein
MDTETGKKQALASEEIEQSKLRSDSDYAYEDDFEDDSVIKDKSDDSSSNSASVSLF